MSRKWLDRLEANLAADENGQWICNDALFEPSQGGMWGGLPPADGYVEPV